MNRETQRHVSEIKSASADIRLSDGEKAYRRGETIVLNSALIVNDMQHALVSLLVCIRKTKRRYHTSKTQ